METFFLTFGQKYAREPHPTWSGVRPDGWVAIEALDYLQARSFVIALFGTAWSDVYEQGGFDLSLYPAGELLRLRPQGVIHEVEVTR